jgi:hypothetical protein
MRFMMMHKVDAAMECGTPPSPEMMERMGAFMGESTASGQLLGGEGLQPSRTRTRVKVADGEVVTRDGPYAGDNELPARALLIKVTSRSEALDWATRYARAIGDGELELGPVAEAWDMGFMPKPDDAPLRFLLLHKADDGYERGMPPSPKQKAAMTRLIRAMTEAGVLTTLIDLVPGRKSTRLHIDGAQRTIVDGPFSESKEMIAGYGLLELPSREVAIEAATRFASIFGPDVVMEIDIRPVGDDRYAE